jgi:hypothetical protein
MGVEKFPLSGKAKASMLLEGPQMGKHCMLFILLDALSLIRRVPLRVFALLERKDVSCFTAKKKRIACK